MARNVTGADIFGGMFQNIPGYEREKQEKREPEEGVLQKGKNISDIPVVSRELLHAFRRHPYRVVEDDAMRELAESIRVYGMKEPVLVRPDKESAGTYEIISGHRRNYAAGLAGLTEIPVHIEEMDDDMAAVLMVDSNNKREILLPSEKAWAYRIKADALRHQGKRNDLAEENLEDAIKTGGMKAVGEKNGDSERTVRRYIRLTYLMQELLALVDAEKLPIGAGYMISFFNREEQECILHYFKEQGRLPGSEQLTELIELHKKDMLDGETVREVMEKEKAKASKSGAGFSIKRKKLEAYFPEDATEEYVENIIFQLLKGWADGRYQAEYTGEASSADESRL